MIASLLIQNLVLVEKEEIRFGPGLNILTGETGAGKSAILAAIRLILGERADAQLIRAGSETAVVEATLRLPNIPQNDLSLTADAPFHLRRELHRSGKSRTFVNDQLVSLQQLKVLIGRSIELVDQSTSHRLAESEEQRYLLDSYSSLGSAVKAFEQRFSEQIQAEKKLEQLIEIQQTSRDQQKGLAEDLETIQSVNWLEGEEEALGSEHALLTHSHELLEKISTTTIYLLESSQPVIPQLKRFVHQLESLVEIAPKIQDAAQQMKNSLLELEDAAHQLISYADRLDADPARLEAVERRMGEIESLKKRFGSFETVQKLKENLSSQIDRIANLDTEIEIARTHLATLQAQNLLSANKITQAREKGALSLGQLVMSELKQLNLPHARFAVHLEPKPLSGNGANAIHFLFAANPGQPLLPLDQCASGGELSRLLFAIKTALAEKEESGTLIFDEIDSNVGGQTAAILGAKLQTMAQSRQLICVTHFVQVARCAADHFLVSKQTTPLGAFTTISKLIQKDREKEFARMTGGESSC